MDRRVFLKYLGLSPAAATVACNGVYAASSDDYHRLHKKQVEYFENITDKQAPFLSLDFVEKPEFSFAMVADPHIGNRDMFESNAMPYRLIDAWKQINAFCPAFVLNLGDIATGWPQRGDHQGELKYALYLDNTYRRVPIHYTPGNHDLGNKRSQAAHQQLEDEDFGITPEKLRKYRRRFGSDYYSFHQKGYRFISINSQLFNSGLEEDKAQWSWLEDQLEQASSDKGVFIFTHYPLFLNDPKTDPGPKSYEVIDEPARSRLINLFKDKGVNAVFSGHTHWPSHSYMPEVEFHTFYSSAFTRVFFERDLKRHFYKVRGAWRFNPYKAGIGLSRVYPDKTITQFVQTYPRLPEVEPFQQGNRSEVRRILPKSAAELEHSWVAAAIDIPQIEKERRLADRKPAASDDSWLSEKTKGKEGEVAQARDYNVSTPIELACQRGVKRLFIKQAFTPGAWSDKKRRELSRFLDLGIPRGAEIVLPVSLDEQTVKKLDLSKFNGKIIAYQLLGETPTGEKQGFSDYLKLAQKLKAVIKEQSPKAELISRELDLSSEEDIKKFTSSDISCFDGLSLKADIDNLTEQRYRKAVKQADELTGNAKKYVHLVSGSRGSSPLEPVSKQQVKMMLRIFAFNKERNISSLIQARTECSLSLVNNDYDPTFLFYSAAAFNTVNGCGLTKLKTEDYPVVIKTGNVQKQTYKNRATNAS